MTIGEVTIQAATALMVPIVTAAVGTAGLMAQDRWRERDFGFRHKALLEKAQLEVQFITSWIQARKQLEPAINVFPAAESWLDRCYQSAEEASSATPPKPSQSRFVGPLRDADLTSKIGEPIIFESTRVF
ncbi:hypothetical protein [Streptomyces sp. GbtcB6]|uniref:hypothetical protein n=1 Tax=Streptomyces sp. GbtcB6 TaxID=2824751 RepID=UPI001C2F44B0|nr:hypothetical protein [Streptomyces sp. GbtcB6]